MLVFWTVIGCALVLAGLVTYGLHAAVPGVIQGQPALVVLGALIAAYVQLVYPAVTWLSLEPEGFVLRTLPGRRTVPWAQVGNMESVSALTPAGRGGNLGGVRVRDMRGRLILIVPDVFTLGRDSMLSVLEQARRITSNSDA